MTTLVMLAGVKWMILKLLFTRLISTLPNPWGGGVYKGGSNPLKFAANFLFKSFSPLG